MENDVRNHFTETGVSRRKMRGFWIVLVLFLAFSAAGWMRAVDAGRDWSLLVAAGVQPGPLYLIISGALWGVTGLAAAIWMLFHLPRLKQVGLFAAFFIALTFWLDRLLFSRAPGSAGNTLFALLMTVLLLGLVVLVLTSTINRIGFKPRP